MLRSSCLPVSVTRLLEAFRPCFTTRGFYTFTVLVTGLIAKPVRRTVCGMLTAAGMSTVWSYS